MSKACILSVSSSCGKDLRNITKGSGLAIPFRDEAHSFVCFAGMLDESGSLSLAADDVDIAGSILVKDVSIRSIPWWLC
jgi:hypothetical protein